MSKTNGFRTLLLEPLESRCLLAVAFAETPPYFGHEASVRAITNSATEASRNYIADPSNHRHSPQPKTDRVERLPRYHSFEKGPQFFSQPSVDRLNNNQTPLEAVQFQPRRSEALTQLIIELPPSFSNSKNNTGSDLLSSGNSLRPTIGTAFTGSTPSLSSVEVAVVKEEVRTVAGQPSARSKVTQITLAQRPVTNDVSVTAASTFLSTDQIVKSDTVSSQHSQLVAPVQEVPGGIIEIAPLFRGEFDPSGSFPSEIPWELEADDLRQLRSANSDSLYSHDLFDKDTSDLALADWFGHPEGLIDDLSARNNFPESNFSAGQDVLAPTMVEVVLEATVGLYRIVDVIGAANSASPPDNVRGAILAAISIELTPISKLTSPQRSGITEWGIAFFTSSLAFVRRRRRPQPMEWTGKSP